MLQIWINWYSNQIFERKSKEAICFQFQGQLVLNLDPMKSFSWWDYALSDHHISMDTVKKYFQVWSDLWKAVSFASLFAFFMITHIKPNQADKCLTFTIVQMKLLRFCHEHNFPVRCSHLFLSFRMNINSMLDLWLMQAQNHRFWFDFDCILYSRIYFLAWDLCGQHQSYEFKQGQKSFGKRSYSFALYQWHHRDLMLIWCHFHSFDSLISTDFAKYYHCKIPFVS